jgi:hypothetical protein
MRWGADKFMEQHGQVSGRRIVGEPRENSILGGNNAVLAVIHFFACTTVAQHRHCKSHHTISIPAHMRVGLVLTVPVQKLLSSLSKNRIMFATSSGFPGLPMAFRSNQLVLV